MSHFFIQQGESYLHLQDALKMATRVLSSTSLRQNKMLTQLTTPLNGKHEDVLT